ncbi:MAG TPA: hypothetical protein VKU85_12495 [bacterium]|nr:hypothetical protein [bacterium]
MSSRRATVLLVALAALLAADAAWWLAEARSSRESSPLQAALLGIGRGSAAGVDWSFFSFDPGLEAACENELWPIPGLPCPNPHHGAAAVDPPPRPHSAKAR